MSAFNFSGPAEILRAEQKDDELCERINRQLTEFLLKFKGHVFANKHKQFASCASQTLYYALTTISGLQTLGEEYARIVQVGHTGRHIPGFLHSVGMVSVHVFGDRLVTLALDGFVEYVRNNDSIAPRAKRQIVRFATALRSLVPLFQSLNRVLFYWNGSFNTWAKRFFNIRHIYAIPWYRPERPLHAFKILSALSAVHLTVHALMASLKGQEAPADVQERSGDKPVPSGDIKCPLCLEPRRDVSLSPCGHLFCWRCIHEWLQTNHFCPICRKTLNPRNIVPLQNFT